MCMLDLPTAVQNPLDLKYMTYYLNRNSFLFRVKANVKKILKLLPVGLDRLIRQSYRNVLVGYEKICDASVSYFRSDNNLARFDFDVPKVSAVLARQGLIDGIETKNNYRIFAHFSDEKPFRILEIGTYKGEFSRFLADVYPHSQVVTIDLPDVNITQANESLIVPMGAQLISDEFDNLDLAFLKDQTREFLSVRDQNLDHPRIDSFQFDSFELMGKFDANQFDMVWVDGDHWAPHAIFDIQQAWYLCKPDGVVCVDDLLVRSDYRNTNEAFNAIKKLTEAGYFHTHYIPQRLNNGCRYYISISKKVVR